MEPDRNIAQTEVKGHRKKSKHSLFIFVFKTKNHLLTQFVLKRITVALTYHAYGFHKLQPFFIVWAIPIAEI